MPSTVTLPNWLVLLGGLLAAWALLDRLLVRGLRWLMRRRTERLLESLETRFRIRVEPFKRT